MRHGQRLKWVAFFAGALVWTGCGNESQTDSGSGSSPLSSACTAGTTVGCFCADGTIGSRVCEAPGEVPTACNCGAGTSGSGGSGGGAGTGAQPVGGVGGDSGGAGGTGGTDASAGIGGAGGAAGMAAAGTGGTGGTDASAGAGGSGGTDASAGTGGTSGTGGDVPDGAYCAAAATWDPAWTEFEVRVLELTNEARAAGHNCDTEGNFGPAGPLTMNPILRCSARLHSQDMGVQGYFEHTAPDGRDPFDRMMDAGYSGYTMGENIAKGQQTPEEVVAGWLDSDGHCANIMNPDFTEIGVGYWEGAADNQWFNGNKLWTQNFGAPAPTGGGGNCPWYNPGC